MIEKINSFLDTFWHLMFLPLMGIIIGLGFFDWLFIGKFGLPIEFVTQVLVVIVGVIGVFSALIARLGNGRREVEEIKETLDAIEEKLDKFKRSPTK